MHIEALLDAAAADLPDVTSRRLFGCHALYRGAAVFALVWKTGRIGVKLPDPARHGQLMAIAGAEPWKAHAVMKQWVLVPPVFHEDPAQLARWVAIAHDLAAVPSKDKQGAGAKTRRRTPTTPAKKEQRRG